MPHALRQLAPIRVLFTFREQVVDMDRHTVNDGAPGGPPSIYGPLLQADRDRAMMGAESEIVPVSKDHRGILCRAKFVSILSDGFENRAHIRRRRRDDP